MYVHKDILLCNLKLLQLIDLGYNMQVYIKLTTFTRVQIKIHLFSSFYN